MIINGKSFNGTIFESGTKTFAIETVDSGQKLDVRMLYEKDGAVGRTTKGIRLNIEDVAYLIQDILAETGLPFTLESATNDPQNVAIAEGART